MALLLIADSHYLALQFYMKTMLISFEIWIYWNLDDQAACVVIYSSV